MPSFELEDAVRQRANNNDLFVAGVDEVGIGACAGPIISAAVVLRGYSMWLANVDDSKKLTSKRREEMYDVILENAVAYGIGYETNVSIDEIGIAKARRKAMITAFQKCKEILGTDTLAAVVDGYSLRWMRDDLGGESSLFSNKADSKSYSVAAASILAKVIRDRYMTIMSKNFPQYDWEKNKGYGTPKHLESIKKYGPSPLHRLSFKPFRKEGK